MIRIVGRPKNPCRCRGNDLMANDVPIFESGTRRTPRAECQNLSRQRTRFVCACGSQNKPCGQKPTERRRSMQSIESCCRFETPDPVPLSNPDFGPSTAKCPGTGPGLKAGVLRLRGRRIAPTARNRELRSCDDPNPWCMYICLNLNLDRCNAAARIQVSHGSVGGFGNRCRRGGIGRRARLKIWYP